MKTLFIVSALVAVLAAGGHVGGKNRRSHFAVRATAAAAELVHLQSHGTALLKDAKATAQRPSHAAAHGTERASTPRRLSSPTSWGLRAVGAPSIWHWGTGSSETIVAVLDTGVDSSREGLSTAVVRGWNVLTNSADTTDDNGHGTEVAGVIAARPTRDIGVSGYCQRCTILPVKVLDATGRGSSADVAAGILWAVNHGARIVNLSFVLSGSDAAVSDAIEYANAHGVAVVAATGNSGGSDPHYPAADPNAISVAAATPTRQIYRWSVSGAWVTTAAPGCNSTTGHGRGTVEFCGTSSAAAAVSGLLGLAVSDAPGVTVSTLRSALVPNDGGPRLVDGVGLLRVARRSLAR